MRARVLASKLLHFVSFTDSFIMLDVKLLKPRSLMYTTAAYRAHQLSGLSRNGPCIGELTLKWENITPLAVILRELFFSYVFWNI